MPDSSILFQLLQFVLKDRTQLALENVALRQQLGRLQGSLRRSEDATGSVVSKPVLGGLHHCYSRAA